MDDMAPDLNDMGREHAEDLLDGLKDGTLTSAEARDELTQLWGKDVGRPGMLLTSAEWRDLWRHAGHIHMYCETNGGPAHWKLTDRRSTKVRLYRTSNAEFRFHPSWTEDEEQAMKWIDGDTVWTAKFEPERLLATADLYSATNQETEYIAYAVGLDLEVHHRRW
ncbi:hypothetical protein [Rhodococcus sp. ARC_M6]|uniref:hypothetical protein n=1 Tax=Rhodococcus sp. ARC_M6 TaxID=2928852 RepID=UPI001FB40463|nr:hypothetical protein [Rhodococcus sp. ARC_M6]MCJ0905256.1 hypothetical protein [Rhodococcus sp. ARC_M6]